MLSGSVGPVNNAGSGNKGFTKILAQRSTWRSIYYISSARNILTLQSALVGWILSKREVV